MLKIGILCAGDEELAPFLPHIQACETTQKALLTFYSGQINGVPIVALYSGVCKVNAAIATQILIDAYQVDAVINAGAAGGMDERVELFDLVVSTQAAYHDVAADILTEFHPWLSTPYFDADPALLAAAQTAAQGRPEVRFGKMLTGEAFIEDDQRAAINAAYAPLSVDMETAAVAHVCHANHIPFLAARAITDTAAHMGLSQFEQNCKKASELSKDFVLALLQQLA